MTERFNSALLGILILTMGLAACDDESGGSGSTDSEAGAAGTEVSPSETGGNLSTVDASNSGSGGVPGEANTTTGGTPSTGGTSDSSVANGAGSSGTAAVAGDPGTSDDSSGGGSNSGGVSGNTHIQTAGNGGIQDGGAAGTSSTETEDACDPAAQDSLEVALERGDPSCVTSDAIEQAVLDAVLAHIGWSCELLDGMFEGGPVSYTPGNRTQLVNLTRSSNTTILTGNGGNPLAIAGFVSGTPIAAMGSVPPSYFALGENLAFQTPFTRLLEWLMGGADTMGLRSIEPAIVAIANMHAEDATDTSNWLAENIPTWSTVDCDGNGNLEDCFTSGDLLLVGWDEKNADPLVVRNAVEAALARGTPVLYLHTWYEDTGSLSDALSSLLGFTLPYGGNYWSDDAAIWSSASETPGADEMGCADPGIGGLRDLVTSFVDGDLSFDWSQCDDDKECNSVPGLADKFYNSARTVRNLISGLESTGVPLFDQSDEYRLDKLLVLLGDKYREAITYPMVAGETDDETLLKALFADHAAMVLRKVNPAQSDLGTFSPIIAQDYPTLSSSFTTQTRTVDFTTSARVYALPGRTIRVERTDSLDAGVSIFVNYLRDGSSHIFGDAYDRPAFLQGNRIPLLEGAPLLLTSPYGGIVYLELQAAEPGFDVSVSFENVGQHPVYSGPGTEARFKEALDTTQLGWAEMITPAFEVHSRLDLMQTTVANAEWGGDVTTLVDWTWKYLYQDVFGLAGFVGTGLEHPQTALDYCSAKGWDCNDVAVHGMQYIQHANMDRALCGFGCSGNPYDAYWDFSPLGWGDAHEIGHNIQRSRLKIYGNASGEVSNNIFPIHSRWHFNRDGLGQKYGRNLDFMGTYLMMQNAQNQSDPTEAMHQGLWVDGDVFARLIFYWQLVFSNADVSILGDHGWDLIRILYLLEREFDVALRNDSNWQTARAILGFDTYTTAEANAIEDGNDFMLVAISHITGRDHRPFFDMWGVIYSAKASAQVEAWGYPQVQKVFWVTPNEEEFSDPYPSPLPVDGISPWPY